MKQYMKNKVCEESRPCFAKGMYGGCTLLTDTYPDGSCPFCKPEKEVTNGISYPYKGAYAE